MTICGAFLLATLFRAASQEASALSKPSGDGPVFEYASVRFMEERTSIVWPDGSVENVLVLGGKRKFDNGSEKYPKGSDYRVYWLTVSMNIMGKRGFQLAHMDGTDVVMKRQVK